MNALALAGKKKKKLRKYPCETPMHKTLFLDTKLHTYSQKSPEY
jgi:hypothetical protein